MIDGLWPARTAPPSRIVAQELEARNWSQGYLATLLDCSEQQVTEIISGGQQITPEMAQRLARSFGTSLQFWTNLEHNFRTHLLQRQCCART